MSLFALLLTLGLALVGVVIAWQKGGALIVGRDTAGSVRPELAAFMDWWERYGPFPMRVAGPEARWPWVAPGGVRAGPGDEKAQALAFSTGQSKAATLDQTSHGHAAGLDLWPVEFDPRIPWADQPASIKSKFALYGAAVEMHGGLRWGGRFLALGSGAGDQPHCEVIGWESFPVGPYTGKG